MGNFSDCCRHSDEVVPPVRRYTRKNTIKAVTSKYQLRKSISEHVTRTTNAMIE